MGRRAGGKCAAGEDALIDQGITAEEVDRFVQVMADPDSIMGSSVLISTWGRRPGPAR
jgi:hypothetical protein